VNGAKSKMDISLVCFGLLDCQVLANQLAHAVEEQLHPLFLMPFSKRINTHELRVKQW